MSLRTFAMASSAIFLLSTASLAQSSHDHHDHDGHNHGQLQIPELTAEQTARAAANYKQYCALCHGENREGGANDHAPSLRSKSLMSSSIPYPLLHDIQYGRAGTPMAGYLDEIGGPMNQREIAEMAIWLFRESGAEPLQLSRAPVTGNPAKGEDIFKRECSECHGTRDEEKIGPMIGNPAMLATIPDLFLHYAIKHGREDTKMPAYADTLTDQDINDIIAHLRDGSDGWTPKEAVLRSPPAPENYAINPTGPEPQFNLQDGIYVSSKDLDAQIKGGARMILLDTRATSMWQLSHIEGAVPLPYYSRDEIFAGVPRDTWVVAYCECPRAAAESVVRTLRSYGYTKTAVLYEGIYGWTSLGYPIKQGELKDAAQKSE